MAALAGHAPGAGSYGVRHLRPVPGPGARRRRRGPKGLRAARGAPDHDCPGLTAARAGPELRRARAGRHFAYRRSKFSWRLGAGALRAPLKP
jgi:hypothetical protein